MESNPRLGEVEHLAKLKSNSFQVHGLYEAGLFQVSNIQVDRKLGLTEDGLIKFFRTAKSLPTPMLMSKKLEVIK